MMILYRLNVVCLFMEIATDMAEATTRTGLTLARTHAHAYTITRIHNHTHIHTHIHTHTHERAHTPTYLPTSRVNP